MARPLGDGVFILKGEIASLQPLLGMILCVAPGKGCQETGRPGGRAAWCFPLKDEEPGDARVTIGVIPIGSVEPEILTHLRSAIQDVFRRPVRVDSPSEEPGYAYSAQRRQFLASAILDRVKEARLSDEERVLGVADVDLFVPELNFVFGLANPSEHAAVISLTRLRPEFYGHEPDRLLLLDRAVKEAVHELGHTYGLRHCPDPECIMHFSNSIGDTDRKRVTFCPRCRL